MTKPNSSHRSNKTLTHKVFKIQRDQSFVELLTDNLRLKNQLNKRTDNELVHCSDLVEGACLRRQYYNRKEDQQDFSDDTIYSFVRGQSSEKVITELADIGVAQVKIVWNDIIGRPDILRDSTIEKDQEKFVVVELKDTASLGARLIEKDLKFKAYMKQLLYYMVMTGIEHGILSIKYSTYEMIWVERNREGDHYIKPFDARPPEIQSWSVIMTADDSMRDALKHELITKKNLFRLALDSEKVEILPRLVDPYKKFSCKRCEHFKRCWLEDDETEEAAEMSIGPDILDTYLL